MRGRRSALVDPNAANGMLEILYRILGNVGQFVSPEDRDLFYDVAVEPIPYGSYNAEACFPTPDPPFVLLDTGTVDFIGNITALYQQLRAQANGTSTSLLSEQQVIDYIWASALIYFDKANEWEARRDAIHAPKLMYSKISPSLRQQCMSLGVAHLLFLVLHEIAHVIADAHGGFSKVSGLDIPGMLGEQFEEGFADTLAFDLIIRFSTHLPHRENAVALLSGVDCALSSISLIQNTFPVHHDKENKIAFVAESFDHPLACVRRQNFRAYVNERMSVFIEHAKTTGAPGFLSETADFDDLFRPYGEAILNGRMPSDEFQAARNLARQVFG